MKSGIFHRLDTAARQMVPFGITVLLLLLGMVPIHVPGFSQLMPWLALMSIFHWGMYRPELMPGFGVFLLGVLQDTLLGTPIGLHSIIYLGVYGAVTFQHGFFHDKSFAVIWMVFSLVAGGGILAGLVLVSLVQGGIVAPGAAFFQYLLTVGFFPVISWLLSKIHRLVLESV